MGFRFFQNLEEKSTQELDTNTMYLVFLTNSRSYFKKMKTLTKFAVYWLISRGVDYTNSGSVFLFPLHNVPVI